LSLFETDFSRFETKSGVDFETDFSRFETKSGVDFMDRGRLKLSVVRGYLHETRILHKICAVRPNFVGRQKLKHFNFESSGLIHVGRHFNFVSSGLIHVGRHFNFVSSGLIHVGRHFNFVSSGLIHVGRQTFVQI
jgi:hypothetical protein